MLEFIKSQLENLESPEKLHDSIQSTVVTQTPNSKGKSKYKCPKGENESSTAHTLQAVNKDSPPKTLKCSLCGTDHLIYRCEHLLKKSVPERQQAARAKGLCFNCLGTKHSIK